MPGGAGCARPVPAGGSVGVRMAPADPPRRKRAPKKWLFASETFIKRGLRRGSVSPPGLPKEASKTQVLLCKCTLRNGAEKPLGGEGGKGKEREKKNICVLFIYSEPRTLPIILYITRCLGKSCSETIFVTRENPACAFAPLGESIKHFVPYETRHAQID